MIKFKGLTIRKNKNCNSYYTRYRENGIQHYISAKTQQACLKLLKEKLNYTKEQKIHKTYTTFDEWYNQWFDLFKKDKVKSATITAYKSLLKHIPDKIKKADIKKITSLDIQTLLNNIQGERTKQKLYEFLNDIFTKAEKYKMCDNILSIIDKPKHTRKNGNALTTEDKEVFIQECLKQKKYILLLTLYQGLRKGEVLALEYEDISDNEISINKNLNINGKIDTTKNETSNRIIPIFKPTREILKCFTGTTGRIYPYSKNAIQNDFQDVITKCNFKNKYTIHSLRHTFVTFCQDNQIPEHIIQSWIGHTIGSQVTKKVYTHIQNDTNLLFINKLNDSKFYSHSTQFFKEK